MILISVGNEQVTGEQYNPNWLFEQLERRGRDNGTVCVRVEMEGRDVDIALITPECPRGPATRRARPSEDELFDLWEELGLNDPGWNHGRLNEFIQRVKNRF